MRHSEIIEGVAIYDCNKEKIGYSKVSVNYIAIVVFAIENTYNIYILIIFQFAAIKGIGETIITRVVMFGSGIGM